MTPDLPPLPHASIAPRRARPSLVWIIPILALIVGLGLGFQALRAKGTEIVVQFAFAEGLEANKTRVKFKDVNIGTVKAIALTPDRKSVRVRIQMDKQAEALLVDDTRFWVVRPRVDASGISGLGTLLSGAYIALDPGQSENARDEFVGLDIPPPVTAEKPGHVYFLNADNLGSLDIGAPVYFRRLQVGKVIGYGMLPEGQGIEVKIFIEAPYDRFVTRNARFWHASGFDLAMDAEGVKFSMQSLASLAMGGIAFAAPDNGAEDKSPMADSTTRFTLHAGQTLAMRSPDHGVQPFRLVFNESVRGLSVGAPIDFRGITIGEVSRIDLRANADYSDYHIDVDIVIDPARLQPGRTSLNRAALDRLVKHGLRAQMRTGSVLSGQRYIALDWLAKAPPAQIRWQEKTPTFPVLSGAGDGVMDKLPDVIDNLQRALRDADRLLVRLDQDVAPEFVSILGEGRKTLEAANKTFANADQLMRTDAPLQREMLETLREVGKAAATVRHLADLLERHPEALLTGKKEP